MANFEENFSTCAFFYEKESALGKIQKGAKKRCQYWTAKTWGIYEQARKPNSTKIF